MSSSERPKTPGLVHPVYFNCLCLGLPVISAALVVVVLLTAPQWPLTDGAVASTTWLAVLLAAGMVLVGDVFPVYQQLRKSENFGILWSTAFAIALLTYAGLVPALVVTVTSVILVCLLYRLPVTRIIANGGATAGGVLVAWAVLTCFGWRATMTAPWAPESVGDVLIVLIAIAAMTVFNEVMVIAAVSARTGTPFVPEARLALKLHIDTASAHQLAMTPVIVAVMAHAPLMTVLMVLPVTAVHRALVAQQQSKHAATHDDLTQLPNRGRFVTLANRALEASSRSGTPAGILIVDLNGFKQINDLLGHPVGDLVLVEVAERLRNGVRAGDVVARMGGDEFGVLLPEGTSPQDSVAVAERIYRDMAQPCQVDGLVIDLGASIGIALASQHGTDFDTLYSHADMAMFIAKRERTGPRVYDPTLQAPDAPADADLHPTRQTA